MISFPQVPVATSGRRPELLLISDAEHRLVADHFRSHLPTAADTEPHLRQVVDDTLDHPGSLARAQLVFSLAHTLTGREACALALGTAVEYLHTASLLFDDLPSMDDATERRGRPCPHVTCGEAAAILGALAFVNAGYRLLWQGIGSLEPARRDRAADLVNDCLGLHGILNGQARDLHFAAGARGAEEALDAARGKTVTLIRLTLVLPALVGGSSEAALQKLNALAESWGLAYQILDDCKDCLRSFADTSKSTGRDAGLGRPNYAVVAGLDAAQGRLTELLASASTLLADLVADGLNSPALLSLHDQMEREARKLRAHLSAA